jgi:ABC-type antimicrobial peptide transport system permease subunit
MNTIVNDIRFGLRMLWKHRLASLVCAIALGLGIGATAAIFSVAEAFLLHPVPFEDAGRIVALVDTGMPLALALAFRLSSLLFGVTAGDPLTLVGLPVVLASVALLASYLPARRALRVDPLTALRYE